MPKYSKGVLIMTGSCTVLAITNLLFIFYIWLAGKLSWANVINIAAVLACAAAVTNLQRTATRHG